ncbi:MAG: hypothetical protein LBL00_06385 [Endomicrobium sp.]|jgi:hypothetical protein|nr:hypothetical protein [Endomicrobium sp.]
MNKNNSGQSLVEALFVVTFTTIIMFAFLQVCIIVVDDMTANEAAFVAMRSAAVTKSNDRKQEAQDRVRTYLLLFYPISSLQNKFNPGNLVYSNKTTVAKRLRNRDDDTYYDDYEEDESDADGVTLEDSDRNRVDENRQQYKDYSGRVIEAYTTKFYYFTRVLFGSLVAKFNSKRDYPYGGARRYQSSRNKMVPSPDEDFYDKAYPGAEKFKNYDLSAIADKI